MTTVVDEPVVARSADPITVGRVARETAVALAVALAAAIVVTWPLATKLGHIAHDPFDPRFQAWTIDWVQHKLGSPGSLFNANIFAPEPNTLAYSDSLLGIAIPLLPLRWLGVSPIGQLNIALLLGFATSAASGYLFGRVATRSVAVGAVTGAAFAFGPFGTLSSGALHATAHAGVGVAAAAAWWLADRSEAGRPVVAPAVLMAAAIAWQASVSFYPGAYAFGAAAIVLLIRCRSLRERGVVAALTATGVALVCTLALAIPYFQVHNDQPTFARKLSDLPALSADFGATDPRLTVWGSLLGKGDDWPVYGEPAFPGAVLLVLAPIGAVAGWRRQRRVVVAGGALVAAGALLGLGAGPSGWRQYLPYRLLFEYVPGWEALRATGRAWVVGLLGVGVLAGLGAVAVGRWIAKRSGWDARRTVALVATIAALGVLVEGYAPWTDRPDVRVAAVDEALAARREPGGVLYLPAIEPGRTAGALSGFAQAENVYGTTAHHRRTPNGYSGFFPPSWRTLSAQMRTFPDTAALDRLRELDVRFVVVRGWARGGQWGALLDPQQARPLRFIGRYGDDLLYAIPAVAGGG
ncbi:MAG: hypothetical protein WD271_05265 [Acidimicrobiia bacterium]